ncbi:Protein of unknown function DUF3102 [uncultured Caudovirales phage]|uniref:DUF3102 domain-containing protein n=1 Tax=uncultured Caudovirales phage TaxID=2100421 RepID=A0A6J5LX32_9CAUD|nr:Protein of unknown function DUF3102 [uncultured Caudovirales phage]
MTSLTLTIDLPFLAGEVNSAHSEVQFHAKSMLLEAKRAGEALLKAKSLCRHGEFKAWVEANCRFSYRRAAQYMVWAKSAACCTSPGAWDEWQRISGHAPASKPTTTAPAFTKEDAEYALKINAMAERGQGGEVEVAKVKLERLASGFGMTADQMVEKAKGLCPEPESLSVLDAGLQRLMAPYRKLSKDRLIEVLLKCVVTHPDLIDMLVKEAQGNG